MRTEWTLAWLGAVVVMQLTLAEQEVVRRVGTAAVEQQQQRDGTAAVEQQQQRDGTAVGAGGETHASFGLAA